MALRIAHADPLSAEGRMLIGESQAALEAVYPPEDIFSLPAEGLARPDTLFLLARDGSRPAGCVALLACPGYGEVKRLFVRPDARGGGVGLALMAALEAAAMAAGLPAVRLETGSRLTAAVALYRRLGYRPRMPFGDYAPHPASLFLARRLAPLPRRLGPDARALPAALALLAEGGGGRAAWPVAPPPHGQPGSLAGLAAAMAPAELWAVLAAGAPVAAMLLAPRPGSVHLERLVVAGPARRRGLARRLAAVAAARARALGLAAVTAARPDAHGKAAAFAALAAMGFCRPAPGLVAGPDAAAVLARPV